jgi:hypothetical protein
MPADRAREELKDIVRMGRKALLQLESIALIDLRSIPIDEYRDLWMETMHVAAGLHERVSQVDMVLQLCSDMQTR